MEKKEEDSREEKKRREHRDFLARHRRPELGGSRGTLKSRGENRQNAGMKSDYRSREKFNLLRAGATATKTL